ncbi:hypothetical protein Era103g20 [Erwinia phage Era103]|uniref:Uncharacterized protein n=1 Tax=Erwinia phage Era103 TaxID=418443 RepID=A2I7Y8_9CAUD|nr:hypothetical protein Era103g20 [Erwinia phage Era103]ABM63410.1 unknown [Erwinia phage Era103]
MKHIVGLIIMALIVLSLHLAPAAGSWVIGTLGSVGILASVFALCQTETEQYKLLIKHAVENKLSSWQAALYQLIRGVLLVALVYGLSLPAVSLASKYLLVAGYLAMQLSAGRLVNYKNTLIRRAYTLKM